MRNTIIIIILFLSLFYIIYLLYSENRKINTQLQVATNNIKALSLDKDSLKNNQRTLKLTISQLEYMNDSISRSIKNVIKENNINKNKLEQLQYYLSHNYKTDTVFFTDTIFRNNINIDTALFDKWYRLDLKLRHPNVIVVNPEFTNETAVIFSNKKETINPPKKFFLLRWFQKKHIVTEIKVVNNNPYCTTDTTRFIEIIKY